MKGIHEPNVELLSAEDALIDVDKITDQTLLDHILSKFDINGSLRDRINYFTILLCKLLALKKHPLKKDDVEKTPSEPGVYLIFSGDICIYVGQASNINRRLNYHVGGNTSNSAFNKKLEKIKSDKEERINYIEENCFFKFIIEEDEKERKNFEHFAIAILNPKKTLSILPLLY